MLVTPGQIKAARAMLDWSAEELGKRVGVVKTTISAIETGRSNGSVDVLNAIVSALEMGGIEFLTTGGIQPRQDIVHTYKGRVGFIDFIWDVYETVKKEISQRDHDIDICVSNVDEKNFLFWLGEEDAQKYKDAMALLEKKFFFKILICEGDDYFAAGRYAEYKWVPKQEFSNVPFYVYGNKLAILLFDKEASIYVIENEKIANAYRGQFAILWDRAIEPNITGRLK